MNDTIQQAVSDINAGMPIDQLGKYYPELDTNTQNTLNQYASDVKAGMPTSAAAQYYPELFNGQSNNNQTPSDNTISNPSVGGFLGNAVKSTANLVANVGNAVLHPIKTVQGLGNVAVGGLKELGGQQPDQQTQAWDNVVNFYKQRYGSVDSLKSTLYTDPAGAAADLASVLDAGAGIVGKIGDVSKVGELSDAANAARTASETINPLAQAGNLIGKGVEAATEGKTIAPFAGSFNPDVANLAEANNINLPISSVSKSPVVQTLEAGLSKGAFGQDYLSKIDEAGQNISNMADNLVSDSGGTTDLATIGKNLTKGAQDFKNTWIDTKNKLYDAAQTENSNNPIPVKPVKTLEFLDNVVSNKSGASQSLQEVGNLGFYKQLKDDLQNPDYNSVQAKADLQVLNAKIKNRNDPVNTGDPATLKAVAANLSEDTDTAIKYFNPDLAQSIDKANAFYKDGITKMNSKFGRAIKNNIGQPEKIVNAVISRSVPSDIPAIQDLVGESGFNNLRTAYLDKIISSSKSALDGTLMPSKLANQLKTNDEMLKAMLTPEQYGKLQDINKLTQAYKSGLSVAKGSQTAYIGKTLFYLTTAFTHPLLLAKSLIGDSALRTFMQSDAGYKLLTSGYKMTGDIGKNIIEKSGSVGTSLNRIQQAGKTENTLNP